MDSTPPKDLKRLRLGEALKRGYHQLKHSISRTPQNVGSMAVPSRSASPTPPVTPGGLTNTRLVPPVELTDQSAGPSSLALPIESTAPSSSPGPATTDKLREAGRLAYVGLETALRILERSADICPPLKSAASKIVTCLDIIQAAATSAGDYEELTSELTTMAVTLNRYIIQLGSEDPTSGSVSRIALSIEAEVAHIRSRQSRSKGRRLIESTQDKEDVIKHYRRIEALFRQLQGDVGLRTMRITNEHYVTTLLRGMSPVDDARYNSTYSTTVKRRGCTAETREKVQTDLQSWVLDPNAAKVYWMNGMAGTGKTTIAYSLCEWLEENQRLGASFFCSRALSLCRDVNRIVPTIVYQLARYSPTFQSVLCGVLGEDPDVGKLNVVRQFEKLVREPMLASKDIIPEGVVVVIDALDECEDDYGVRLVLGTLLRLAANLPLKFFVTSRPESAIRDNMLAPGGYSPAVLHLHDIEESIVEEDIKKYLTEALGSMSPPPSDEQIEQLARRAGKLFIYAATVVRYILPGKGSASSTARLNAMLATDSRLTDEEQPSKRYKRLDELYTTILIAAFDDKELEKREIEAMRLVLWTAICAKEPMTAATIGSLLGLTEEQASSALEPLRSVLHVSETGGLVSVLHASFADYMLDPLRSGGYYCDQTQHSEHLANRCFDVMKEQLRFNICNLESSFVYDKDVVDLEQRVNQCISHSLFYACLYWGEHLQLADASNMLHDKLSDFLTHKLLFWMEVLNLKLCVVKGVSILVCAEMWLSTAKTPVGTQKHTADARDFVIRFAASACGRATPHIYLSALPFCAKSSSVYAHYWGRTKGLLDVKGTAIAFRDKAAQATWVMDSPVLSVAFSRDGTCMALGCHDGKAKVQDAYTGDTIAGPFEEHTSPVNSISFSPDDTQIVSGSEDGSIRVWEARTGDTVVAFRGHTQSIDSVAFSPDGTRIVSGSDDRTIRVWDARTGDSIAGPFNGHTGKIKSIAFSPNGIYIVSGSSDRTIRVWNAITGDTIAGPFKGHTGSVKSVAYSPDGIHVVSGSADWTILVWHARTGDTVAGPFKGHTGSVNSVSFSPDGTRIISGSSDWTTRMWDGRTGDTVAGPFEGHKGSVNSVAFSPDCARVVSASDDLTIRVWDARTVAAVAEPFKGHTNPVSSVAFSPDGMQIASGSSDRTIRVWNARTGDTIAGPFSGHTGSVSCVAFSPDGTRIVSGSSDRTVRVWGASTGDPIAEPFEGHTDSVKSVAFSLDGSRVVSGSYDQTIRVWDPHTGNIVAGPFEMFTDLDLDSDRELDWESDLNLDWYYWAPFLHAGTRVASGSYGGSIRVWDSRTGDTIVGPFKGHTDSVKSVAFSPDGTRIVSGSDDGSIRVWDARPGDGTAEPFLGHTNPVSLSSHTTSGPRSSQNLPPNVPTTLVSSHAQSDQVRGAFIGIKGFKINNDGWITTDCAPLFWVSPDLHDFMPHPHNILVIGPQGSIYIEHRNLRLGERWSECYAPL